MRHTLGRKNSLQQRFIFNVPMRLSKNYRPALKTQGNADGHMARAISRAKMPTGKSMRKKGGGGRGGKIKGKTRSRIVSPQRTMADEPVK